MCEQPSEPPSKHKQNPIKDSNSNPYIVVEMQGM